MHIIDWSGYPSVIKVITENGHEINYEPITPLPGLKRCYVCHRWLPLSDFYKNKSKRDGYKDECKVCFNAQRNMLRLKKRSEK